MSEIENTSQREIQVQSDAPCSEFEKALKICQSLSGYQLTRLNNKIDWMLDEPKRIDAIKSQFAPGDLIEYFSSEENRDVEAILIKHNRTLASVRRCDNGEQWKIHYACIRTGEAEFQPQSVNNELDRDDISVGLFVGFKDRQNQERFGQVIRINQKTATIQCEDGSWRVAFSLLFRIIDASANPSGNSSNDPPKQQLLIE